MVGDIKGFFRLKSMNSVFIGLHENSSNYNKVKDRIKGALFLPIIDIGINNSGFLSMEPKGECIIDIRDMNDVESYFLCEMVGEVILPPGLSTEDKAFYYSKRLNRIGGYNDIVKKMVIMNSLRSGKVDDRFLFAYESEATNEI